MTGTPQTRDAAFRSLELARRRKKIYELARMVRVGRTGLFKDAFAYGEDDCIDSEGETLGLLVLIDGAGFERLCIQNI